MSDISFMELQNGLMNRFNSVNQSSHKDALRIPTEEIVMPMQTFSMAGCSISDQSFFSFLEKMKEIMTRHQLFFRWNKMVSKDYYCGGMAICFARNKITLKSFFFLS
mmetsp:Transcript_16745/g.25810  ORF Transcript_16745/g.25810 Transcript_16745/m.25810 type:complete len:107 (+) Transcript_16745:3264-3584(+)